MLDFSVGCVIVMLSIMIYCTQEGTDLCLNIMKFIKWMTALFFRDGWNMARSKAAAFGSWRTAQSRPVGLKTGNLQEKNPRIDPEKQAYKQDHALAWSCSFYAIMLQNPGFEGNYINKFWFFFYVFPRSCSKYCFCCLCICSILLSLLQNENGCDTIG